MRTITSRWMALAALSSTLLIGLPAGQAVSTPAPSADGATGPILTLSPAGQDAIFPRVAVGSDGDAIVTWTPSRVAGNPIQAVRVSAASSVGPVQDVSEQDGLASTPAVASAADGDAVIAWTAEDNATSRVQARQVSAAGSLGPVRNVSAPGGSPADPQVAVDPDGEAIVVWARFDGANTRIQTRRISAAGALGPIRTLSAAGRDTAKPAVAIDPDGDAVVAWRTLGSSWPVQARQFAAAGTLGPIQTLSASGHDPQVAVDSDGDAVVAWRYRVDETYRIQARRLSAAGVLGRMHTLSPAWEEVGDPRLAVDGAGNAVLTWRGYGPYPDRTPRIRARTVSAAGIPGPMLTLSEAVPHPRLAFNEPRLALDAGGVAMVTWQRYDGSTFWIDTRRVSTTGAVGPLETIAEGRDPAVDVDTDGDAFVTWYHRPTWPEWRVSGTWVLAAPPR